MVVAAAKRTRTSLVLGIALGVLLTSACSSGGDTTDTASSVSASAEPSPSQADKTPKPDKPEPVCSRTAFTRLLGEGFTVTRSECVRGWALAGYSGSEVEGWTLFKASGANWKKVTGGGGPVSDTDLEDNGVPPSVAKQLCVVCSQDADPLALDDGKYPVEIKTIDASGNQITFDLEQMFSGDAADKAAAEDGAPAPTDGYYVRNESKQLRTFDVVPGAPVTVVYWQKDMDPDGAKVITLAQLDNVFNGSASWQMNDKGLYWITISDGQITQMKGQYFP